MPPQIPADPVGAAVYLVVASFVLAALLYLAEGVLAWCARRAERRETPGERHS